MELKKGNRIKYDDSIYSVAAVILSTVYLTAVNDGKSHYDYDISQIYTEYRDTEFLSMPERMDNERLGKTIK